MSDAPESTPRSLFGTSARKALVARFGNAQQFRFDQAAAARPVRRTAAVPDLAPRVEIERVLDQIAASVNAEASAVGIYPANGAPPEFFSTGAGRDKTAPQPPAFSPDAGDSAAPRWHEDGRSAVFALPIPTNGEERMMLYLWFHAPPDQARRAAEALGDPGRPLPLAYLRSWQAERSGAHRITALSAACDASDVGIVLIARSGAVTCANSSATRLLDAGDGLRRQGASIQASEIADSVKLQVALNHVIAANAVREDRSAPRSAPLVRLSRGSGGPLVAAMIPAEMRADRAGDIAAILYVFDPSLDTARLLAPLCRLYQLSPVESRLACLLAAGRSLTQAADALRIKEQTARSYLKNVFIKTDTNRQTELVHLLLTNTIRLDRSITPEPF